MGDEMTGFDIIKAGIFYLAIWIIGSAILALTGATASTSPPSGGLFLALAIWLALQRKGIL
jgi:hypothetical protein